MIQRHVHKRSLWGPEVHTRCTRQSLYKFASTCGATRQEIAVEAPSSLDAAKHTELGLKNLTRRKAMLLVCSCTNCRETSKRIHTGPRGVAVLGVPCPKSQSFQCLSEYDSTVLLSGLLRRATASKFPCFSWVCPQMWCVMTFQCYPVYLGPHE
jgi:hypothetical protein